VDAVNKEEFAISYKSRLLRFAWFKKSVKLKFVLINSNSWKGKQCKTCIQQQRSIQRFFFFFV
jgi:hypothetical protein